MSTLMVFAEQIEQAKFSVMIAESRYAFPVIEGAHLIGLSIAVGLLLLIDLRLMGVLFRNIAVTTFLHHLRPWILGGFTVIFASGGLLFISEATTLVASPVFAVKLLLIALAGINALYFERVIARRPAVVSNHAVLPASVKYSGFASFTLWVLVITCGRLIPYLA